MNTVGGPEKNIIEIAGDVGSDGIFLFVDIERGPGTFGGRQKRKSGLGGGRKSEGNFCGGNSFRRGLSDSLANGGNERVIGKAGDELLPSEDCIGEFALGILRFTE